MEQRRHRNKAAGQHQAGRARIGLITAAGGPCPPPLAAAPSSFGACGSPSTSRWAKSSDTDPPDGVYVAELHGAEAAGVVVCRGRSDTAHCERQHRRLSVCATVCSQGQAAAQNRHMGRQQHRIVTWADSSTESSHGQTAAQNRHMGRQQHRIVTGADSSTESSQGRQQHRIVTGADSSAAESVTRADSSTESSQGQTAAQNRHRGRQQQQPPAAADIH